MENKNLIVALVLMVVVWAGFNFIFPPQPTAPQAPVSTDAAAPEVQKLSTSPAPLTVSTNEATDQVSAPIVARRQITIETPLFDAVLDNAGACIESFQLHRFGITPGSDTPRVQLVDPGKDRSATLKTKGGGDIFLPADALYQIGLEDDRLKVAAGEVKEVVFRHVGGNGLTVEKVYRFRGDSYDFDLSVRILNQGSSPVRGSLQLSLVHPWDEESEKDSFAFIGPATLVGDTVETTDVEDLAKEAKIYGPEAVWTAYEDKYFMSAVVPLDGTAARTRIEKKEHLVENILESPERSLAAGEGTELRYLLFFGPRDLDLLKEVDHELAKAIDFGYFSPIAKPLLSFLKFFYGYIGNYGWAIIILTVIIKILFWPLTQKSYSSMKAMQKLQPEMQRIREKYKNDRERLNREIMELYRDNRVNPLGGCLPMLIQIPVFFALYKVLMASIELRHAPFAFWLTDLSTKDPYYITPIIMGATMFIQQKMTPSNMDPVQAKIFLMMPVVFTFLFLNFPSGLVIYWMVNNILTIIQQYLINRKA